MTFRSHQGFTSVLMSLFISNTLEKFLDKFEKAPAGLETYVSSGLLVAAAEKEPTLVNKCELMLSCCTVRKWY